MKNCKPVCCDFFVLGTQGGLSPVHRFGKRSAEMICLFLVWHFPSPVPKYLNQGVEGGVSGSLVSVCLLFKES